MRRLVPATASAAAAALLLAACGSSPTTTQTTLPRPSPLASGVNPCSLLDTGALSAALHTVPAALRAGPTCTYVVGPRSVQIRVIPASAASRQALTLALAHRAAHARRLSIAGAHGYAAPVSAISTGRSTQAQATLIRGSKFVAVVLTDPDAGAAALVHRVSALGAAAAGRL